MPRSQKSWKTLKRLFRVFSRTQTNSKEVRGSFAILFWLPCVTWHRVMTHTHHTQSFRSTDAFLSHSTPGAGPISKVSWGFLLHPSGLSFGFQARCTGSTRRTKDVDFRRVQISCRLNDAWKRGMDQEETSTTSIDRRAGEWVHGRSSEPLLSCSLRSSVASVIFPFCAGGPGEWAVVRLPWRRWTPAQDSCWCRQRRLLDVDLVSAFTISQSAFLWQCSTSIFIFVVLHLCTRRMISRQSPLKQTDSS